MPSQKLVVYDAKPYDKKALDVHKAALKDLNLDVVYLDCKLSTETAPLAKDALIVSLFVHDQADKTALEALHANGCRMLALRSAGFDYVDLQAAASLGMEVTTVPSYSPHSIAEFTIGLLISLARRLHIAFQRSHDGDFSLNSRMLGFELHRKVIGVVGTGRIGKLVAQAARGFGMKVLLVDMQPDLSWAASYGLDYLPGGIKELLPLVDVLSLQLPLTPATRHIMNDETFALMRPGAILLNTSRGALIDSTALIRALKSCRLGGVAIDVYERENDVFDRDWWTSEDAPMADDTIARLMTFPNVLITAHQAYFTMEALGEIAATTVLNISEFMTGKRGPALTNSRIDPRI